MASFKKITIEIVGMSRPGGEGASLQKEDDSKKDGSKQGQKKENEKSAVMKTYVFNNTKNLINQAVNTTLNRYYALSENYKFQNTVTNLKTTLSTGRNLVSSIVAGAEFGPVGAIAGAVIGVASEGINLFNKYSNYYQQLNATNMQTEWTGKRMGLYDEGRGTEN